MSFKRITVVGNLGKDPDLKETINGVKVCTFSLATTEKTREGERTTWFRITLWREKAELASKFLKKGNVVYVEGKLHTREYADTEGIPRTTLEISAIDLQFLPNGNGISKTPIDGNESVAPSDEGGNAIIEDEIPF